MLAGCEASLEAMLLDLTGRKFEMGAVTRAIEGYGYDHQFEWQSDGVSHTFWRANGCKFSVIENEFGQAHSFSFQSDKSLCTYTRSNLGLQ
jgi:hypothetical protein